MVVLGRKLCIVNNSVKVSEFHTFRPEYEALRIPIVDATTQYDDTYSGEKHMLVRKEALHVT